MASARDQHACPSPPCHPGAVEARSTAKREVEGVLARECAHVERVIDVGAGPPSSREQRDGHPCRCRHGGQLRRSGRAPLVAMVEPAHFGQLHDLAHAGRLDGSRPGRVFAQRKMGPCPVTIGQSKRKPVRCHRTTVSGLTTTSTSAQRDQRRDRTSQKARSLLRRRGRPDVRWKLASC